MTPDEQKAWDAFVAVYRKWPFAFGDEETRDGVFAADDELAALRAELKRLREEMRSWSINGGPSGSTTVCPECKRDVGWTAAGLCYDCIIEAKNVLCRRAEKGV